MVYNLSDIFYVEGANIKKKVKRGAPICRELCDLSVWVSG